MDRVVLVSIATSFLSAVGVCRAADGDLDPGFGSAGIATSALADHGAAADVAIQRDGKIVVVGTLRSNDVEIAPQLVVARYLADGTPDEEFAGRGYVTARAPDFPEAGGIGKALLLEDDGAILALGDSEAFSHGAGWLFLARYTVDGDLDESFGEGGFSTPVGLVYGAGDLARAASGEVLVSFIGSDAFFIPEIGVARLGADGRLDPSFGNAGVSVLPLLPFGGGAALVVAWDGRITVASSTVLDVGLETAFAFARLLADGSVDVSFGAGGLSPRPGGVKVVGAARDIAMRADGRLVVAGTMANTFAVVGLDDVGDPLAEFAEGGVLSESFATSANALAPVPGGQVVAGGGPAFAVARVLGDGSLDPDFGNAGVVETPFGDATASALAVAVQDDGAIVVAGTTGSGMGSRIALARYVGAPPLAGDGNGDGLVDSFDRRDLIREIFDGDGNGAAAVKDAGVRSAPGVDANGDGLVAAADLIATAAAFPTAPSV